MTELAITVIGTDRPGIVADVAEALAGLGANLTDSTMTRLRGHFAMTLVCNGPAAAQVEAALAPLSAGDQLLATVRQVRPDGEAARPGEPHVMSVHGADRLGIVAAVTRVLAESGGNITDLTTRLTGPLYLLVAEVDLPPGTADEVYARLADVARTLDVEVKLRPVETDFL
jgi:glycine cleavage system transcriptional repressor